MGERTSVNYRGSYASQAPQRSLHVRFDLPLLLIVVTLTVFGLLMVYSASWKFARDLKLPDDYFLIRQVLWVALGAVAAIFLSLVNYHRFQRFVFPLMVVTLAALLVVLFLSNVSLGSVRSMWGGSIRPSELAKMAIVLYLSFWIYSKNEVLNTWSFGLLPMIVMLGVTAGLVLGQPDLSAAATIILLGAMLYFLGGGELRTVIPITVIVIALGVLVTLAFRTGQNRIADWVNGLQNPVNASYHVQRSLEAVVNGGLFGVGIGRASSKFTGLPVAPTDSIFAIIAEETGLIGSICVIVLFVLMLWRGMVIAQRAPDLLGRLLASGLTLWIFIEAMINMGVMVNLLPFAGNALPFISSGGSSVTTMLASIGIIMNVARVSHPDNAATGRSYSAVVDLRGRNGRRSVSGPVRPPSSRQ